MKLKWKLVWNEIWFKYNTATIYSKSSTKYAQKENLRNTRPSIKGFVKQNLGKTHKCFFTKCLII